MAIDVDGKTYRTWDDKLFCNDRRVLEVTVDGKRVYPEEKFGSAVVKWSVSGTSDAILEESDVPVTNYKKIGTVKFKYVGSLSFEPHIDRLQQIYLVPSNSHFSILSERGARQKEEWNWRTRFALSASYDIDWDKVKGLRMTDVAKSRLRTLAAEGFRIDDSSDGTYYRGHLESYLVAGGAQVWIESNWDFENSYVERIKGSYFVVWLEDAPHTIGYHSEMYGIGLNYPGMRDVIYTSISHEHKAIVPDVAHLNPEINFINVISDYNPPIWAYDASLSDL